MGWVQSWLLAPTFVKIRPFDLILLTILLLSSSQRNGKSAVVAPMRQALLLILGTTIVAFCYGIICGGEFRYASWQTYLILSTVLLAFTVASTFRTAADFVGLSKWLIAAAVYRATMCWISYFTWGRSIVGEAGAYLTSHDDTIGWVVSILVLIVNAVDKRSLAVTMRNIVLVVFFVGAIQWNSRRLAWVSLAMGLAVLYLLFPKGATKRRMNRIALTSIPFLCVYTAVGWGSQSPLFLPLRSLSTISTSEDASTLARNTENLGLIATANGSSFAFGTGWGRPYTYLSLKYDISSFELWRYIPHNSILGVLAFTGVLGFAGFWLALPTAVFLHSRTARLAKDPRAKSGAIIGAAQLVVCANQLYGDMGIFDIKAMYVIAVSYAMALRLPQIAGVWDPNPAPRRP